MATFHHKPLKRFNLNGMISDEAVIWRLKEEYIRLLVTEMRLAGYVPRLDIVPDFTVDYNEKKKFFEFELTLYGVYIGRRQSEWIIGLDEHKAIPTPKNKLKESSQVRESQSNQK
jgi:hypothetical protein